MKRKSNSRVDARANAILAKAGDDATALHRVIDALAESLVNHLHRMHGGSWRIDIDHEVKFVVVRQCPESNLPSIRKADLREAI